MCPGGSSDWVIMLLQRGHVDLRPVYKQSENPNSGGWGGHGKREMEPAAGIHQCTEGEIRGSRDEAFVGAVEEVKELLSQ